MNGYYLSMNQPKGDDMEHQRVLVAAIKSELGGRGWTRKYLGELAGITEQQMERIFNLKRDMNVQQFGAIADALGVTMDYLAGEARRWGGPLPQPTRQAEPPEKVVDPRTLIQSLLDEPERDDELVRRLSEARTQVGSRSAAAKRLMNEIRLVRQGELKRALDALPQTEPEERQAI